MSDTYYTVTTVTTFSMIMRVRVNNICGSPKLKSPLAEYWFAVTQISLYYYARLILFHFRINIG